MAGKGTRLRPFTLTCPKPLLQIIDKPIVEHLIDQISSRLATQIDEIIYILGDEAYFNSDVVTSLTLIAKKYNAKSKVYRQLHQLGTGHAIMCAEESLDGPSIVAYADTMIQGQILIEPDVDGIIWVKKVKNPSSYGVVRLDEKQNIIDLIEKPQDYISDLAVVGIYYFKDISIIRDKLKIHLNERLSPGKEYLLNHAIEKMIENNKVFKTQEIETWMDCGTPRLLIESAKKIMNSQISSATNNSYAKTGNVKITPPVFIGKNVKIKDSEIGPFVSIGDNTDISNSNIKSTLIFKSVKVSNADIRNSILGENSLYDGSNRQIFLGDYSQINDNEAN